MFSASNGAYRRTKIVIDWLNIGIGVVMIIMATAIFIRPQQFKVLIPLEFFLSAAINGLHAAKYYFKFQKKSMILLSLVCIFMFAVMVFSIKVLW